MNDHPPSEFDPELPFGSEHTTISPTNNPIDPVLVIAFVAAVGVNLRPAEDAAQAKLIRMGYRVINVRVTEDVFPKLDRRASSDFTNDFDRIWTMMDIGTNARKRFGGDIVACGIAAAISEHRKEQEATGSKVAYLVHSLKHPEEVRRLREIYSRGFYLIGVHAPPDSRKNHLQTRNGIDSDKCTKLMERDRKEDRDFGQQLVDTFHLSDFFTGWQADQNPSKRRRSEKLLRNSIERFLEIMFGHPNRTPTFGEHAMFLAFSNALRSADLSRQVGAVIAKNGEILGAGANDCPKAGGGLYWPTLDPIELKFVDVADGRDWRRKVDSNRKEQVALIKRIIEDIRPEIGTELRKKLEPSGITAAAMEALEDGLVVTCRKVLNRSPIKDLTEFGRVVHAEMEALLSCARKGISTVGATLYSTTFPCHNCAKHIIAAGIERVVFIEPYLKSKAMDFHSDAIEMRYPLVPDPGNEEPEMENDKVKFEPFFGVGPRRFFDLFSMEIGAGYPLIRKEKLLGGAKRWSESGARVRVKMTSDSYLERESDAGARFYNEAMSKAETVRVNEVNESISSATGNGTTGVENIRLSSTQENRPEDDPGASLVDTR